MWRGLAGRAWTRGARVDSRGALGLAVRAWTRGARLDSRGAPGLAVRAWTRGGRLDSRCAPGLAGRAWTRGARLDSRGALGLAGRGATPLRRVSDSHYRRCSYTGWLSLNVVKPNALTPLCPAGRGVNIRTGPLAIHCAAE